ncbi:MAG: hypothetical protein ACM3ZB_05740 [bacterium]
MIQQREFFRLAAGWLACRFAVMHGVDPLTGLYSPLDLSLLGMIDHAAEMRALVAEGSNAL